MELAQHRVMENGVTEDMDGETSARVLVSERRIYPVHPADMVKKRAYIFDGMGDFYHKDWDLGDFYKKEEKEWGVGEGRGNEFSWYHVELPKENQKLSQSAHDLIGVLCPPLKLQDILSLVSNGPFCAHVDRALVFRVNSPGPPSSDFTFGIAARVTEHSVITVSLGCVPRFGFSHMGKSLLSEIPIVESSSHFKGQQQENGGIVINEDVLEFLLTTNHCGEADSPVPRSVSNLVVHIIDTHVDQLQDLVTKLEMELNSVELDLDKGSYALKKLMLDDRRFPKLHINLQHLLQVIVHGEQVYLRVKEKCSSKRWFANEDINSLEELFRRLRKLKEYVGFIVNHVTAIQAGVDSWQSEQVKRKLYYLSFLSIIFLLSIIIRVFSMNVGGGSWISQNAPELKDGFRNVMLLCVPMLLLVLLYFVFQARYTCIGVAWRSKRAGH